MSHQLNTSLNGLLNGNQFTSKYLNKAKEVIKED